MSKPMKIELIGYEDLVKLLLNAEKKVLPSVSRGLYEEAQLIFRRSQFEVPFKDGILKGSGILFPPEVINNVVDVWIGYGGNASLYAMWMHQGHSPSGKTVYNFKKGKKKEYLSDPMKAASKSIDVRLTKRLVAILGE